MRLNPVRADDPALFLAIGLTDEHAKIFFPEDAPIRLRPSSEREPDAEYDRESDDEGISEINHSDRSSIF